MPILFRRALVLAAAWLAASAGVAEAACKLGKLAELPVTVTDLQPLTPVKLNDADAPMLIDSGAFFSMITPAYAAQLKLPVNPGPVGMRLSGIGGSTDVRVTTVKRFGLAGATVPDVDFIVAGGGMREAAGLIGQNVLQLGDVEFDLANGAVRLIRPQGCGSQPLAYWVRGEAVSAMDIQSTTQRSHAIIGTAFVNGKRIHVMLDSGSQKSVLSRDAAARAGLTPDTPGVTPAGVSMGVGRKLVRTWLAPVDSFKIGDEEVKHTKLRFGDLTLQDADMLLGADFLLSHHVYVAFSQDRMYFTYNGGPVFDLSTRSGAGDPAPAAAQAAVAPATDASKDAAPGAPKNASESPPESAEEFSRHGAALASRGDYDGAVADFGRAMALKPDDPRFPLQRAEARLRAHQPTAALGDLDTVLRLRPDDVPALILRARVGVALKDAKSARDDVAAASHAAAPQADERLTIAQMELDLGAFDPAVADSDAWIEAHRDDARLPVALDVRCRARAFSGAAPDRALRDCDAAVSAAPRAPSPLASRAMVRLRRGEADRALADADAALRLDAKAPWALYVRGLAKRRQGDATGGDADIAGATTLSPKIAERAKQVGLTP